MEGWIMTDYSRIPFRQLRITVKLLQSVTLMAAGLLVDKLDETNPLISLFAEVVAADTLTRAELKSNPTRNKLLAVNTAWYTLADEIKQVLPADQPKLITEFEKVLEQVAWIKPLAEDAKARKADRLAKEAVI